MRAMINMGFWLDSISFILIFFNLPNGLYFRDHTMPPTIKTHQDFRRQIR